MYGRCAAGIPAIARPTISSDGRVRRPPVSIQFHAQRYAWRSARTEVASSCAPQLYFHPAPPIASSRSDDADVVTRPAELSCRQWCHGASSSFVVITTGTTRPGRVIGNAAVGARLDGPWASACTWTARADGSAISSMSFLHGISLRFLSKDNRPAGHIDRRRCRTVRVFGR